MHNLTHNSSKPLAERVRPETLAEYAGQSHLVGEGTIVYELIQNGRLYSMLFWGPPGTGKTTLARILCKEAGLRFYQLSAVSAGVAEVRKVIDEAKKYGQIVLFIDEIHRFNKSQQDALLGAVENGDIILIGATTENPGFEVNNALLSRCQVYVLEALGVGELQFILDQALAKDEWLRNKPIEIRETDALFLHSEGDARKLLTILEMLVDRRQNANPIIVDNAAVKDVVQLKSAVYDKNGEEHYNIISAFIKSMRGSDPNAAVYWLARMLEGGENIEFIARRMLILAAEDIGLANPNALLMATSCFQAIHMIGMPEARIILSECAVYLATSAKSNASYMAIDSALETVRKQGAQPVPLHLRNAPVSLMKELNYGKDYKYAHAYENHFTELEFLPEKLSGTVFYEPGQNPRENEHRKFLKDRWKDKYGY